MNNSESNLYIVKEPKQLFDFLTEIFPGRSRTKLKSILSNKLVSVDGKRVSQFNYELKTGQKVQIGRPAKNIIPRGIEIYYEDSDIIIVEKKSGILSVSTQNERDNTVFHKITEYLHNKNEGERIYVVHRLDQYTSGIMMFAKRPEVQYRLRNAWKEFIDDRVYVAVVEGVPEKESGTFKSFLKENKMFHMYSTKRPEDGKLAITHYKLLKKNDRYSLVEVKLDTGRKNQIRVHFSDMGIPVAGDRKYGAKTDPCGRLMLHARLLSFTHPGTGKQLDFDTGIPDFFEKLVL